MNSALANSGTLSIGNVRAYWVLMGGGTHNNANSFGYFVGRTYYKYPGVVNSFPNTNLSISTFYGTSPIDEWSVGVGVGVADGDGGEGGGDGG